jgi:hypothetical protein
LRSFVRLLDVLAQDYDVSLMNPPYGSQNRMPNTVKSYVNEHFRYTPEFYINFFEVCDSVTSPNGRIGMLVPWSFMMKQSYRDFREDFVGERGEFDFLSEFGYGILDNATVGTVGTVVRTSTSGGSQKGTFLRLHDVDTKQKERKFLDTLSGIDSEVQRYFNVQLSEFAEIPGTPISYSIPKEVRDLHRITTKIDAEQADIEGDSIAIARQGLATANDERFVRQFWEVSDYDEFPPIAKGGSEAWLVPPVTEVCQWNDDGQLVNRLGVKPRGFPFPRHDLQTRTRSESCP